MSMLAQVLCRGEPIKQGEIALAGSNPKSSITVGPRSIILPIALVASLWAWIAIAAPLQDFQVPTPEGSYALSQSKGKAVVLFFSFTG